jgi:hypothetical protein
MRVISSLVIVAGIVTTFAWALNRLVAMTSLAIVAVVVAVALTGVAFAVPQQVLAYRHHHNHNSIKVDQQISQANVCTGASSADTGTDDSSADHSLDEEAPPAPTVCLNTANNTANVHG